MKRSWHTEKLSPHLSEIRLMQSNNNEFRLQFDRSRIKSYKILNLNRCMY